MCGKRSPERIQFLADVIVTATEGGTGYWAFSTDYHWSDEAPETTRVTVHEMADDDDTDTIENNPVGLAAYFGPDQYKAEGIPVTIDTVAHAISRIITSDRPDGVQVGDWVRKAVGSAAASNDAGEIDSSLADVIVQVAALGCVKYG